LKWIADTNVISETQRKTVNKNLVGWLDALEIDDFCTTSVNIAELMHGVSSLDDPAKRSKLALWISGTVRPMFLNRIFSVDEDCLVRWRMLLNQLQRTRKPNPPVDILIAAIAVEHGCGIATRDVGPFLAVGLPLINPFTGERFNGA
jgi:predicted nucleic acid-binding protein